MYIILFLKSFFTGFFAACLVGPVFTLILYRAVTGGARAGILSALGMATADSMFFCFSVVSNAYTGGILTAQIKAFEVVGGPLMVAFGLWTLLRRGITQDSQNIFSGNSLIWQPLSVLLLTLSNPLTFLFFGSMASQLFPELINTTYKLIFLSSLFIGLGSFSLLLIAVFVTKWQKQINAEVLVNFFKILSGLGLLMTGGLLTLKSWLYFHKNIVKHKFSHVAPKKLISIINHQ